MQQFGDGRMVRTVSGRRQFNTRDGFYEVSFEDQMRALEKELDEEAQYVPLPDDDGDSALALERDLERVASDMSESTMIGVTVRSNNGDDAIRQLSVRPSQNIRDTIVEAFSCDPAQVEAVEFGGEAVEEGATYEDYGVEVDI